MDTKENRVDNISFSPILGKENINFYRVSVIFSILGVFFKDIFPSPQYSIIFSFPAIYLTIKSVAGVTFSFFQTPAFKVIRKVLVIVYTLVVFKVLSYMVNLLLTHSYGLPASYFSEFSLAFTFCIFLFLITLSFFLFLLLYWALISLLYAINLLIRIFHELSHERISKFLNLIGKSSEPSRSLEKMQTLIFFRFPFSKIICCILGSVAIFVGVFQTMIIFSNIFDIGDNKNALDKRVNITEHYVMFPSKLNIHTLGPFKDENNNDSIQEKYFVKRICKNLSYEKILKFISFEKIIVLDDAFHNKLPIDDNYLNNYEYDLSGAAFPLVFIERKCNRSNGFEIIDKQKYEKLKNIVINWRKSSIFNRFFY